MCRKLKKGIVTLGILIKCSSLCPHHCVLCGGKYTQWDSYIKCACAYYNSWLRIPVCLYSRTSYCVLKMCLLVYIQMAFFPNPSHMSKKATMFIAKLLCICSTAWQPAHPEASSCQHQENLFHHFMTNCFISSRK